MRNRIGDANFLIVFHCNYGSILLSFRDMTMGLTSATNAYLVFKEGQQNIKTMRLYIINVNVSRRQS